MLFHILANGAAVVAAVGLASLTATDCRLLNFPRRKKPKSN